MFDELFAKIREKNPEIKVIGVWGKDGLELEEKFYSKLEVDLDFTGAEVADIISKIESIKIAPSNYFMRLNFQNHLLLIFSLTNEYFLIVIAEKKIISGKLQFYIDTYRQEFLKYL